MRVKQLMSTSVVTVLESATCHDAVDQMVKHKVRHLPVVGGDGRLRGMVTDRDIRHHLFVPGIFADIGRVDLDRFFRAVPVRTIMSSPVVTVAEEQPLEDAAMLMVQRKIGALPVVAEGRVVGMITETDLLRRIVAAEACGAELDSIVVPPPGRGA